LKIFRYLKPYWFMAILSPLFMVGEVMVDLLQPKLMSKLVDVGIPSGDMSYILSTGIIMLLLVILGGILGISATGCAVTASQSFGNDLRREAFSRVMSLSLEQTDKFSTGSLVTRLTNDITAVENLVSMALRMFVRAPMNFIGGIIMALSLDADFGLVLACALPVQLILLLIMAKKVAPMFSVIQKKLDRVNSVVQENISGARVIKAYTREDFENERFTKANNDLTDTTLHVQKLMMTVIPFITLVMNASVIAIIVIGGFEVEAGEIGVGSVMAAVTYITQILMSLMMVGMMFQTITRATASAKRINEVLDSLPAVVSGDGIPEKADLLAFEDVSFSYPGMQGRPVLDGISFTVKKGETLAILGSTGSGKTSLINLIPRFYDPTDGRITLSGRDIKELDLELLRQKIGCVLQKSELFSGSIADNIRWGREDADDSEVIRAARIAQADDFISAMPDGYDTIIGQKGASLSGGQKQRISIARALIRKPEILIFDDSTSALDLGTEARLRAALKESFTDTAVIIIAQRVASVKNADRILLLDNGRVSAIGNHDELMSSSELYRDIFSSQQFAKEEDDNV